jgi:hypothetical protein
MPLLTWGRRRHLLARARRHRELSLGILKRREQCIDVAPRATLSSDKPQRSAWRCNVPGAGMTTRQDRSSALNAELRSAYSARPAAPISRAVPSSATRAASPLSLEQRHPPATGSRPRAPTPPSPWLRRSSPQRPPSRASASRSRCSSPTLRAPWSCWLTVIRRRHVRS